MGFTPNLNLFTISEADNPTVKSFFQNIAGDVLTSNMQKIDKAVKETKDIASAAIPTSAKGKPMGVASLDQDGKVPDNQLPNMDYIPLSQKGVANGVATLGASGRLLSVQLPDMSSFMKKTEYDPSHAIANAGGIDKWIAATYENAEVTRY